MSHSGSRKMRALRLDDPIMPNQSLGGIQLRLPIEEIEHLLNQMPNRYSDTSWCEVYPPWEVRYLLGSVAVAADVRSGKIFKILALPGYKGTLFGKIGVGMTMREAISVAPDSYFDDVNETFLIAGHPGVALDISEVDPDLEKIPDRVITTISVFAVETPNLR